MSRTLSYRQVAELLFDDKDVVDALVDVVEQHKNWGAFRTRTPSFVLVSILDSYKALAEQQLGNRVPILVDPPNACADEL